MTTFIVGFPIFMYVIVAIGYFGGSWLFAVTCRDLDGEEKYRERMNDIWLFPIWPYAIYKETAPKKPAKAKKPAPKWVRDYIIGEPRVNEEKK